MAILKIARMGHPILSRPAGLVADPTAPDVRRLLGDMRETLADAGGVGLAAPQIHVPLRVVIFFVPAARGGADVPLTELINPVIEPLAPDQSLGWEACLSVPGLMGLVPRWEKIRYRGLGPDGHPIEREAEGFHARVVQHECDHLEGRLYPTRMTDLTKLGFEEEMRRLQIAEAEAAGAEPEPIA